MCANAKFTRNQVTGMDLAHLFAAFEAMNGVTLSLSMVSTVSRGKPDLQMTVTAFTKPGVYAEPVALASSQFSLSSQGFVLIDSAIMFALYQIDFELAAYELEKTKSG